MANQITGRIRRITESRTLESKDKSHQFRIRELTLDATRFDPYTGERGFENYPTIEFTGDKCAELDQYRPGEVVSVSFDLQGTKFVDAEGNEKWITRVRGYRIERRQPTVQPPQPTPRQPQQAPQQPYAPQPSQQGYATQQPQYPAAPQPAVPVQREMQWAASGTGTANDLPF